MWFSIIPAELNTQSHATLTAGCRPTEQWPDNDGHLEFWHASVAFCAPACVGVTCLRNPEIRCDRDRGRLAPEPSMATGDPGVPYRTAARRDPLRTSPSRSPRTSAERWERQAAAEFSSSRDSHRRRSSSSLSTSSRTSCCTDRPTAHHRVTRVNSRPRRSRSSSAMPLVWTCRVLRATTSTSTGVTARRWRPLLTASAALQRPFGARVDRSGERLRHCSASAGTGEWPVPGRHFRSNGKPAATLNGDASCPSPDSRMM